MSAKQISETIWEIEYPAGEYNVFIEIKATDDGLVIGDDIIFWDDIEKAKEATLKR